MGRDGRRKQDAAVYGDWSVLGAGNCDRNLHIAGAPDPSIALTFGREFFFVHFSTFAQLAQTKKEGPSCLQS